ARGRARDRHAQLGRARRVPRRPDRVVALRPGLRVDPARAAARRDLVPDDPARPRAGAGAMIVVHDPSELPAGFAPTVVAIGKFDGVHAGHRAIIEKLLVDAAACDARTVAVTFDRNPLATIAPEHCPEQVSGVGQKIDLLAERGLDATLVLEFDKRLADVPAEEFVIRYLVEGLNAQRVLVGEDFRFGRGGTGDVALLRRMGVEHGFAVEVVADVSSAATGCDGGRRVSSTWIRELLTAGDVERAAKLLGHVHAVRGVVVRGLQRGRELGFPTANL